MAKNRFSSKILCLVLVFVIAMSLQCFASSELFGKIGYMDEALKSVADDAVILRIQNNTYLYDNVETQFSLNTHICPFVNGDDICAPVEKILVRTEKLLSFQVKAHHLCVMLFCMTQLKI